jgi:hypothetical protein
LIVTDAVAVLLPSAGRVAGENVTAVLVYGVFAGAGLVVWSMLAEPLPPVAVSVALTVHHPAVLDEM